MRVREGCAAAVQMAREWCGWMAVLLLLLLQIVLLEETLMLHLGGLLVAAAIEAGGAHA